MEIWGFNPLIWRARDRFGAQGIDLARRELLWWEEKEGIATGSRGGRTRSRGGRSRRFSRQLRAQSGRGSLGSAACASDS
jgi:hypothetical protein